MSASRRFGAWLVVGATALQWACGGGATPGVHPSVTFERPDVRIGTAAQATFQFLFDRRAPALSEDYVVRLELLDTKGAVLWSDEHTPPAPTSRWVPGETVSYSRVVLIPLLPYLGETKVAVELDSPATHTGMFRGLTTVRLLPPFELLQMRSLAGWYPEYDPADPRIEWRWSGREAIVAMQNPKIDVTFSLYFEGRPDLFPSDDPQHLIVLVGDRVIERIPIDTPGPRRRDVLLPADALGVDDVVNVTLRVDNTFRPADLPGSDGRDTRELGIRLLSLFAEPRHPVR